MTLGILLALMTTLAAVGLVFPLVRRRENGPSRRDPVQWLEDRIGQIDAEVEARTLQPAEAEALRAEARRRLLAEAQPVERAARPLGERSRMLLALGLAAVVALSAAGLYSRIGRPDLADAPARAPSDLSATADVAHPGSDVAGMIGALEAKMKQSPGDPEGWRLLGWSYMRAGRYADAAGAYGRAAALDPGNGELVSAQGEALTQAAGGQVTPAAKAAFAAALARNPRDPRARYFLAMARDQSGDHAGAMADWIALLRAAPPDAPWVADVRAAVIRIAAEHAENIAARLPASPTQAGAATPPGPAADQVAAAPSIAPDAQQAMITGMVSRLAARLKADPRDPDGWVRLMRARIVLGDPDGARSALRDALAAYGRTPAQQAAFHAAARSLRIPGA